MTQCARAGFSGQRRGTSMWPCASRNARSSRNRTSHMRRPSPDTHRGGARRRPLLPRGSLPRYRASSLNQIRGFPDHGPLGIQIAPFPSDMAQTRSALLRYGVAVAVAVASTLLAFPLNHILDAGVLLLYVPAVMTAAWVGGLGPGLVATVLSVIFSTYFFLDPRYSFAVRSAADFAQLVVFSFVAFFISLLHTAQKRTQGALLDSKEKLSLVFDV